MSDEREESVESPEDFDALAEKYFPSDEPEPEPEDAGDEAVDDTADEPDEPVADAADEAVDETDEPDEPTPPAKPATADLIDKELQQIQQLRATLARQVSAVQANPTPEAVRKVEATQSRLDAILEQRDDVDPYKAALTLAEEGKAHEAKLTELQDAVNNTSGLTAKQMAAVQGQMARIQFKLDHPTVADRYDEFARAAAAEVDAMLGEAASSAPPEVLSRLDNAAFMRLVEAAKAEAQAEPETAPAAEPPRKKPVATNPVKTKSGASTKPADSIEAKEQRFLKEFGVL